MSLLEVATRLQQSSFTAAAQTHAWIVPTLQSIHIVMIGVVFVSMLVVALRVLGLVRTDETLRAVWSRFAPFFWTGIAVMAATGLLLTLAEPVRELMTLSFRLKLLMLAAALASAGLFGHHMRAAQGMDEASAGLRAAAAVTVVLWLFIIFLGRAIAYDDLIWGGWSPAVLQGSGA